MEFYEVLVSKRCDRMIGLENGDRVDADLDFVGGHVQVRIHLSYVQRRMI